MQVSIKHSLILDQSRVLTDMLLCLFLTPRHQTGILENYLRTGILLQYHTLTLGGALHTDGMFCLQPLSKFPPVFINPLSPYSPGTSSLLDMRFLTTAQIFPEKPKNMKMLQRL